ncbi:hypothetical protein PHYSODRAFT_335716 [Phytophthora sojae]|uniref:Uncharacterized protein n=1 Tax=Phytophthora sojae (strain P6497) TaxID=1094619 RepID=G4ZSF9_PHYSP|nr:hypothetical protein PHYSODRAFT_335716 [Phytophthora sojae]EGZ14039.1 hypothetical protein PHYSODRAFT_335716 [Phytophthora sojae]|eukprot:XP_009531468.1 hypothetical protein PHYSODRAFT_335716 [Phytophthora sojae]
MGAGSTAPEEHGAYEETLGDDEMAEIFRRWLATRSKPVTPIGGVTLRSLDSAWTVFLERWNTATGAAFVRKLEVREATHAQLTRVLPADQHAGMAGHPRRHHIVEDGA